MVLGVKELFDPTLIVNLKLSLADGAIRGWDRRNLYYYQMLTSLAKHYKFDIDIPFARLPKKIQQIILYGSNEIIRFHYKDDDGNRFTKTNPFEGIIPNLNVVIMKPNQNLCAKNCEIYCGTSLRNLSGCAS